MEAITIREAAETDLAAVLGVYTRAGLQDTGFEPEEARRHFGRFRTYPSYRLFVAEAAGAVCGTYALLIVDSLAKRGRPSGLVENVAVLPEFQGRGVGRAMMEHALAECRRAGCYKLALSSNLRREGAHNFYDALGFERHGYSFVVNL
jgi:GNAT superfamily N-acetyltransferase